MGLGVGLCRWGEEKGEGGVLVDYERGIYAWEGSDEYINDTCMACVYSEFLGLCI